MKRSWALSKALDVSEDSRTQFFLAFPPCLCTERLAALSLPKQMRLKKLSTSSLEARCEVPVSLQYWQEQR